MLKTVAPVSHGAMVVSVCGGKVLEHWLVHSEVGTVELVSVVVPGVGGHHCAVVKVGAQDERIVEGPLHHSLGGILVRVINIVTYYFFFRMSFSWKA